MNASQTSVHNGLSVALPMFNVNVLFVQFVHVCDHRAVSAGGRVGEQRLGGFSTSRLVVRRRMHRWLDDKRASNVRDFEISV